MKLIWPLSLMCNCSNFCLRASISAWRSGQTPNIRVSIGTLIFFNNKWQVWDTWLETETLLSTHKNQSRKKADKAQSKPPRWMPFPGLAWNSSPTLLSSPGTAWLPEQNWENNAELQMSVTQWGGRTRPLATLKDHKAGPQSQLPGCSWRFCRVFREKNG